MGSSWCFENDPCCVVLYSLQLLDAVAWSAVEHSIAVVDPGQDKTTGQCLCQFRRQQVSNVSDGLCMVIARSRHRRDVLVKQQTPIKHDSLISSATGKSTPATDTDDSDDVTTRS